MGEDHLEFRKNYTKRYGEAVDYATSAIRKTLQRVQRETGDKLTYADIRDICLIQAHQLFK